ncbi:MAG: hypothetical protein ETSY2_28120 [Candidatus Entotheonella gemina]|uniref:Glycosyltransferase 2-like domain-containing protein n=2 Tax=Candidatus Entotheonella TaxID=93171 RepID=W4M2I0_9BACT|nr:MAG: hypothetical protein ETSY2_28120 [Candidatus Entotheonella gemina]
MLKLKIIINCGPCEAYIGTCLKSVQQQTYTHWEAYVTVDPHGNKTFEKAREIAARDRRIVLTQNARCLYSMTNVVHAIDRSQAQPEDVIVILDGDDWFYDAHALQTIVDAYATTNCWMTYGSWVGNVPDFPGRWPAYPEGTADFRHTPWLGTAVRTWKKWLWTLIDDADLRDENGAYFRVTEDRAAMLPMLEMSGTRHARHIPDILMLYNRANPHCCGDTKLHEMRRNAYYLSTKPSYKPLADNVISLLRMEISQ